MKLSSTLTSLPDQYKKKPSVKKPSILSSSNKMAPSTATFPGDHTSKKPNTRSTTSAWNKNATSSNVDFLYSTKMEKARFESDPAWVNTVLGASNVDGNGGTKPDSHDFDRLTTVLGPHTNDDGNGDTSPTIGSTTTVIPGTEMMVSDPTDSDHIDAEMNALAKFDPTTFDKMIPGRSDDNGDTSASNSTFA